MFRLSLLSALLLLATLSGTRTAAAQGPDWRPPSRQMPGMPRAAELQGDWLGPRAAWFGGVERVSSVSPSALRAVGEARPGSDHTQIVRFTSGPLPVVVWSDRNGDARADLIEIFRSGGVIIQLVDADYDGSANVLRVYNASGTLLRQEPM